MCTDHWFDRWDGQISQVRRGYTKCESSVLMFGEGYGEGVGVRGLNEWEKTENMYWRRSVQGRRVWCDLAVEQIRTTHILKLASWKASGTNSHMLSYQDYSQQTSSGKHFPPFVLPFLKVSSSSLDHLIKSPWYVNQIQELKCVWHFEGKKLSEWMKKERQEGHIIAVWVWQSGSLSCWVRRGGSEFKAQDWCFEMNERQINNWMKPGKIE